MAKRWVENTASGPRQVGGRLLQPGEGAWVDDGPLPQPADPAAVAFSTEISLAYSQRMPFTAVTGALNFTSRQSSAVEGAVVDLDLLANGLNTPTFAAEWREWGGSQGFDNRNGIRNSLTFFRRCGVSYYSISQAVNAPVESLPVAPQAPSITSTPAIVGTPTVGAPTGFTAGVVSGSPTPSTTQQWTLDGVDISEATGSTYTPVAGDVGKALRVRQTASNASGNASSTSAPVSVVAAASSTFARYDSANTGGTVNEAGNGTTGYTYTSPSTGPWSAFFGILGTPKVPDGAWFGARVDATNTGMIGLSSSAVASNYTGFAYGYFLNFGTVTAVTAGSPGAVNGAAAAAVGDLLRIRRIGTSVVVEKSTDNGATWPTTVHTWTGVSAGATLYANGNLYADVTIDKPRGFGLSA